MTQHLNLKLTLILICSIISEKSLCQINNPTQIFGKYEATEILFYAMAGDTSYEVDKKNEAYGYKSLILDSNGTFKLEFPLQGFTSIIGGNRFTSGTWKLQNDTLSLRSYYLHKDFMRVIEKKRNHNQIKLKIHYESNGKLYYPYLEININNKTLGIKRPHTYFPPDTVNEIKIYHYVGVTTTDNEWFYKTKNKNSNYYKIALIENIKGNNYVVENYRFLLIDSKLEQIDRIFNLKDNSFKKTTTIKMPKFTMEDEK
jgi:hypothetical protein